MSVVKKHSIPEDQQKKMQEARQGFLAKSKNKVLTPIKAIRAQCLECSGGQPGEVKSCHILVCPLWPYRMGRRPSTEDAEQYEQQ